MNAACGFLLLLLIAAIMPGRLADVLAAVLVTAVAVCITMVILLIRRARDVVPLPAGTEDEARSR